MKNSLKDIIALLMIAITAGGTSLPAAAQSDVTGIVKTNPIEIIQKESNGKVSITIPDNILQLIISDQDAQKKKAEPVIRPGINKLTGYRIQVFSDGRSQHSLESRAKARGSAIVARFPKYRGQIYTHSSAPNWYTRVGNFRTIEEASSALTELKKAFPQLASEMRIVRSHIVIIK